MAAYELDMRNGAPNAYHFGMYQSYPQSPGLKSIVWQVRGLAPGAKNRVNWTMNYGVAIADWDKDGSTYSGELIVSAELGKAYQVKMVEGDIPQIDTTPLPQSMPPDQIQLKNNTQKEIHLAFALDGQLIAVMKAKGGEVANFIVHPTYYVALYRSVKLGQLVDSGLQVEPQKLEYKDGNKKASIECVYSNGQVILKPPTFP